MNKTAEVLLRVTQLTSQATLELISFSNQTNFTKIWTITRLVSSGCLMSFFLKNEARL